MPDPAHFPLEITTHIFDSATNNNRDAKLLARFCRVNRQWNALARPRFYRRWTYHGEKHSGVPKAIDFSRALEKAYDWTTKYQLNGQVIITASANLPVTSHNDWVYNMLFREILIKDYNAREPHKGGLWCNVLRAYLEPCTIGSFHFFPYRLGEDNMFKVFGSASANELYSLRNGLLMDCRIKKYFYKFSIVIVPVCRQNNDC
jgi:hypothetical protein